MYKFYSVPFYSFEELGNILAALSFTRILDNKLELVCILGLKCLI